MDSDEDQFWWEFKCEFRALLEYWSEIEYEEDLKKTIKLLWKNERCNLWIDQTFGCTPSWWILGHEFGAILGLAFVEGCQYNWDRSWKLELKAKRRAKWQKIKTLETCTPTPVTIPTHTPVTIPTHTPTPTPTLQGHFHTKPAQLKFMMLQVEILFLSC